MNVCAKSLPSLNFYGFMKLWAQNVFNCMHDVALCNFHIFISVKILNIATEKNKQTENSWSQAGDLLAHLPYSLGRYLDLLHELKWHTQYLVSPISQLCFTLCCFKLPNVRSNSLLLQEQFFSVSNPSKKRWDCLSFSPYCPSKSQIPSSWLWFVSRPLPEPVTAGRGE